jgi:tRNA-2-methylthio-N6-dimethylallyladenosine synthase
MVATESYYLETWGCQMNVLDGQRLAGVLQARGLVAAELPEQADLALLNTCAVRDKAVQKVLSRLGELRRSSQVNGRPRLIGLCGCVAEQDGGALLTRHVAPDFVLGPGRIGDLALALDAVDARGERLFTGFPHPGPSYDSHLIARASAARQYVTVVQGCNQHCTFCVVPYTRGHEVSRPLPEIVAESRDLARRGTREVTLLGQTINAYRCPETGADLCELLDQVCAIEELWNVQFITSHPRYFTDALIARLGRTPRLGTYLHLPFQAGADAVLARMHRGYTRAEYLDQVAKIRAHAAGVTLSTDVIVGFPGESEADFEQTLELVRQVRFGQLYGFVFSPRPRTPAARYPDRVSRADAGARLERLFALQDWIQLLINQSLIGSSCEILVDGPAKRGANTWQGRGRDNRVVNFTHRNGVAAGELLSVTITGASAHALFGEPGNAPRVA